MKRFFKILGLAIIAIVIVCGTSFLVDRTTYSNWKIVNNSGGKTNISWAKFEWTSEKLGGKYFDKLSMNIPCKIDGFANNFTFQFDLGANLTGVYENTFSSLHKLHPESEHTIKRLKSRLQFWNSNKCFENFNLRFGNYNATNDVAYVFKNYGENLQLPSINDTIHLGTIGADFFKNKVLIIDYPNMQFAIADNIPEGYIDNLIDIDLDKNGRVILPMRIHNKNYRIMFDNGSSIFPLITNANNISNFSTSANIDTIQISSWGQTQEVTGKLIKDSFVLAGQNFSNVKVYANHSGLGIDNATDGMTGNALFWDKTIIIDFKNKKFGVK